MNDMNDMNDEITEDEIWDAQWGALVENDLQFEQFIWECCDKPQNMDELATAYAFYRQDRDISYREFNNYIKFAQQEADRAVKEMIRRETKESERLGRWSRERALR